MPDHWVRRVRCWSNGRTVAVLVVALVLVASGVVPACASGTIERVSVATDGRQGNYASIYTAISASGRYVAFASGASTLVPGSTWSGKWDVFVHDCLIRATVRVSVTSLGIDGNGQSMFPAMSADGRYVAFYSDATDLVSSETAPTAGFFVRDLWTQVTERVSPTATGVPDIQFMTHRPAISASGRFVAFPYRGVLLGAGDRADRTDVYLRDRLTGALERISVSSQGTGANGDSLYPAVSADGRFVAYESGASNMVPGDTNMMTDVFVRDRMTGITERVSVGSGGRQFPSYSDRPSISADGRYVAFATGASNVTDPSAEYPQAVLRDRAANTTEVVSALPDGTNGDLPSSNPAISADGRVVVFVSWAKNLVPVADNVNLSAIVRDRETGILSLLSVVSQDWPLGYSTTCGTTPSANYDGSVVAFDAHASTLVSGDTNGNTDVFVWRGASQTRAGVVPTTARIGQTLMLQGALTYGAAASPASGETLRFSIGADAIGTAITDSVGRAQIMYTVPEGLGPGARTIVVEHDAHGAYGPATATGTLTVLKGNTGLSHYAASGAAGQSVELKAVLMCSAIKVAGRTVAFAVDGTPVGSATTDANGIASLAYTIPAGTALGPHNVTAAFAGDSAYGPSTRTTAALTVKAATLVSFYPAVGVMGSSTNLRCILLSGSTRVPGKTVWFAVDGAQAGSAVTDADGVATRAYSVPLGFGAGTHSITASFAGDATYAATSRSASCLTVQKANTAFSMYASTGCIGGNTMLKAILLSGSAKVIGRSVDFSVDGTPVGTGATDGAGVAACAYAIPSGAALGAHSVTVSFAGDATYNASARTASVLTVTKVPTAVSLYAASGSAGQAVTLKAMLLSGGTRLVGKTLAFSVEGVSAGSGVTDGSGVASVAYALPALSPGAHNVTASFAGDGAYAPVSRTAAVLTVK